MRIWFNAKMLSYQNPSFWLYISSNCSRQSPHLSNKGQKWKQKKTLFNSYFFSPTKQLLFFFFKYVLQCHCCMEYFMLLCIFLLFTFISFFLSRPNTKKKKYVIYFPLYYAAAAYRRGIIIGDRQLQLVVQIHKYSLANSSSLSPKVVPLFSTFLSLLFYTDPT